MTFLLIFSRLGETIPSPSNACLKAAPSLPLPLSRSVRGIPRMKRTSNSQEIDLYALLEDGVYVYDAATCRLQSRCRRRRTDPPTPMPCSRLRSRTFRRLRNFPRSNKPTTG